MGVDGGCGWSEENIEVVVVSGDAISLVVLCNKETLITISSN